MIYYREIWIFLSLFYYNIYIFCFIVIIFFVIIILTIRDWKLLDDDY